MMPLEMPNNSTLTVQIPDSFLINSGLEQDLPHFSDSVTFSLPASESTTPVSVQIRGISVEVHIHSGEFTLTACGSQAAVSSSSLRCSAAMTGLITGTEFSACYHGLFHKYSPSLTVKHVPANSAALGSRGTALP